MQLLDKIVHGPAVWSMLLVPCYCFCHLTTSVVITNVYSQVMQRNCFGKAHARGLLSFFPRNTAFALAFEPENKEFLKRKLRLACPI